jgi:endonuclease YncB( thermonuclease family)
MARPDAGRPLEATPRSNELIDDRHPKWFVGEALRPRDHAAVGILDSDTLEVLHNHGIDCPEKGQAYGKRAKQAASELVFDKDVTLPTSGKEKYGRTIGNVILPEGMNLNEELVK